MFLFHVRTLKISINMIYLQCDDSQWDYGNSCSILVCLKNITGLHQSILYLNVKFVKPDFIALLWRSDVSLWTLMFLTLLTWYHSTLDVLMQNSVLSCFHIDTVIWVLSFVFAFIALFRLTIYSSHVYTYDVIWSVTMTSSWWTNFKAIIFSIIFYSDFKTSLQDKKYKNNAKLNQNGHLMT